MLNKEKEIKKYEMINIINFIREYNQIRMNEDLNKYQNLINCARREKQNIENQTKSLPNEINNIIERNDINKANEILNRISSLNNNVHPQYYSQIRAPNYQSQNINIENFQTDFICKRLNISEESLIIRVIFVLIILMGNSVYISVWVLEMILIRQIILYIIRILFLEDWDIVLNLLH